MNKEVYVRRLGKCSEQMDHIGIDLLLQTKPSNMFYLTGDGRLCAYAMITADHKVGLGVPVSDIEDVKVLAYHDQIVGFDDEIGMIGSIAHFFQYFDIKEGTLGMEDTFLTQSMLGLLTHPHAKPDADLYHIALDIAQVSPEQVVYIDDRAMFVEVAQGLGIKGILHTSYETTRKALEALGLPLAE